MKFGFIYITTNNVNGKKYIGKCTYARINGWEDYLGSGKLVKKAIEKYGIENFSREIVCEADSKIELDIAEKFYINLYDACKSSDFYNIASGGDGGNTRDGYSEEEYAEYCKKFSAPGQLNPMFGRTQSDSSKQKNGAKTRERFANDPEYRKKHSRAVTESMKYVDREKLKFENRSRNVEMTCVLCGAIEMVYTSQQQYCSECKAKYSHWTLGELKKKKSIENIC